MNTSMTAPPTKKLEQFKDLLRELFQLDHPDLDFGLYRIMNQKREEVEAFLDEDLLPQVEAGLKQYVSKDQETVQKRLDERIAKLKDLNLDPEKDKEVQDLRELAKLAVNVADLGPVNTNVLVGYFSHEKYYRRAV